MSKKIEMTTTSAGPAGNYFAGDQRTVDDELADQLVNDGFARYISEPSPAPKKKAAAKKATRKRAR